MGDVGPGLSPVMEAPCQCTLSQLWSLVIHPSEIPFRYTLPKKALIDVPFRQTNDDFNFKRVLQCFLPLAMYPFGLKERKKIHFLINVPFGHFSLAIYPFGLKEKNAERVRGLRAGSGGARDLIHVPCRLFFA